MCFLQCLITTFVYNVHESAYDEVNGGIFLHIFDLFLFYIYFTLHSKELFLYYYYSPACFLSCVLNITLLSSILLIILRLSILGKSISNFYPLNEISSPSLLGVLLGFHLLLVTYNFPDYLFDLLPQ